MESEQKTLTKEEIILVLNIIDSLKIISQGGKMRWQVDEEYIPSVVVIKTGLNANQS